jgi:type I restriction enzyme R subunit
MEECIKDPHGVLPGKTIFFCSSISHAYRIERIFDALYPEYCGELAKVLVSDDPKVYGKGGLLDQFTNTDMPRVAISVDMLDTGIDIRELVNLVFAKPVYSYTKFWQMIGRGTRLLDERQLKPWCPQKELFLIMDCWDNFDYFTLNPTGKGLKPQVPLPVRFVGIRIDKIEQAMQRSRNEIAAKEIRKFRAQIAALPQKSVVIMEAAADLRQVRDDVFWNSLSSDKFNFLRQSIKPLFRTISQTDFKAMRFEKDVLETSLAHLMQEEEKFEVLKDNVIEQIGELPLSVNIVAREAGLIHRAQTNNYWATITDAALDDLAEKLAPLMKFQEQITRSAGLAKFDLKDLVTQKEIVEFGPEHEAVGIARYREMVEARVLELTYSNPVLQKLKLGQSVSQEEAIQLADLLHDEHPHITENLLRRIYKHRKASFLQFISHILGLERLESFPETVAHAFDQFIQTHTDLTARQLEFLSLLREYIIEHGTLQKRDLIQAPFTIIHSHGIRGVFAPQVIDEILELTENLVA